MSKPNLINSILIPETIVDKRERVLLVENNASIRQLVKQALLAKGYKVLEAFNGKEAIRICRNYPYKIDILITDMVMPVISGVEVINEFLKIRSNSKILIISEDMKQSTLSNILLSSNAGYLEKPFSSKELITSLDNLFSKEGSLRQSKDELNKDYEINQ